MQPANNTTSAKVVSALIIGLIIGFGAGAFWQERRLGSELPSEAVAVGEKEKVSAGKGEMKQSASAAASMEKSGTPTVTSSTAALLVTDQLAGGSVAVAQVITAESVWVAVREEKDGKLANILGVQKVPAGTNAHVVVELLRPTKAGANYFVVLHKDVGDPAFNYREDVLIPGVEGRFTAR